MSAERIGYEKSTMWLNRPHRATIPTTQARRASPRRAEAALCASLPFRPIAQCSL